MSMFGSRIEKENEKHISQGGQVKEITIMTRKNVLLGDQSIKINCCVDGEGNVCHALEAFAKLTKQ
jgi:hypothetical protein